MRRRRRKGSDVRLLSSERYIINGMINQVSPDKNKDVKSTSFDYREIVEDDIFNNVTKNYKGKWKEIFGNDNPIHIEVGTGRGQFITTLAQKNPNINYIGLEVKEEVLLRAVEKAEEKNLSNMLFIWGNVELMDEYFDEGELDRIYINFCDPWHKKRNAKRRLTHTNFLELYRRKLSGSNCGIHFKTDNRNLFEFSLNEFCGNDWKLLNISLDLANSEFEGNVTTEYEDKFMSLNMPIYRLEAIDIRK